MDNEYIISVGEPWDFKTSDGQNIIKGAILKILSKACLVFKSNSIINIHGLKGDILILTSRSVVSNFYDLKNTIDLVTINGGLLLNEYNENTSEQILKENSKFIIIGTILPRLE
jgi:hypothetical protein